jgi:geranylgeranyl diphosphate synthase type I
MLVHDDLIDGSRSRRGAPTLHEAVRRDGLAPAGGKQATDLGLVAGDLLCALGWRMIAGSGLEPADLALAQRLVADMLVETGLGEALDVLHDGRPLSRLGEREITDSYLRKTARYTISGPLVLGASLAGASAADCLALRRYGDRLGLAYQLRNDLDGLGEGPDDDAPDLDSGKRTLVLWLAHRRLDRDGRRRLDAALAAPAGQERRRRLGELIRVSGAADECASRIEALLAEAAGVLRDGTLDASQRRRLLDLTALLPVRGPAEAAAWPSPSASGA